MSMKEKTLLMRAENNFLRGLSMLIVIMSHVGTSENIIRWILPSNICIFVFSSSYGLVSSYINKENYLTGFIWEKIIKKILVPYLLIGVVIFDLLSGTLFKNAEPIFGRNWYVTFTLIIYLGFYFIFRLFKSKTAKYIVSICYMIGYTLLCICIGKTSTWYQAVLVVLLGGIVAANEEIVLKLLDQYGKIMLVISVVMMYLCNCLTFHLISFPLSGTAGALGVCLFTAISLILFMYLNRSWTEKIRDCRLIAFLEWIGKDSYYFYLIHVIIIAELLKLTNSKLIIVLGTIIINTLICLVMDYIKKLMKSREGK